MLNPKTFGLKTSKKMKAFSLIELSIVLIIIGLLVAGVTGGASLIKSAQLRGLMSEARGYNVAVNAFYVQFNALPGDYAGAIGTMNPSGLTSWGNGDGQIQFINGAAGVTATDGRIENNLAWQHLKNAGVVTDIFTPASGAGNAGSTTLTSTGTTPNIPPSKIKSAGWVFDFLSGSTQNVVILTGNLTQPAPAASTVVAAPVTGILGTLDALSVDAKLDDGVANAGKVRASTVTSTCNSTTTYTTSTPGTPCAMTFQVDVNS